LLVATGWLIFLKIRSRSGAAQKRAAGQPPQIP
jgi:hypothetical protein